MFIIRFFLLVFVLLIVLGVVGVVVFFSSIRNIKRQFDRMSNGSGADRHNTTTTVRDDRSAAERNKRIIADGEGEYVDFEEAD